MNTENSDESTGFSSTVAFPEPLLSVMYIAARIAAVKGMMSSFKVPVATMLRRVSIMLAEIPVTVENTIIEHSSVRCSPMIILVRKYPIDMTARNVRINLAYEMADMLSQFSM